MFGFGKRCKTAPEASQEQDAPNAPDAPRKSARLASLGERLKRSRAALSDGLAALLAGRRAFDDALTEALEERLLLADVGVDATRRILAGAAQRAARRRAGGDDALLAALREEMVALLAPRQSPLEAVIDAHAAGGAGPFVILLVGVNGAGKTTTIGKLAHRFRDQGRSVMLAAGDTFRAAAIEQLQAWGERVGAPVIAQQRNADSASVLYDAVEAARARAVDVLIADTAGRLHTHGGLMAELEKIKRVMGRIDAAIPHETLLILDAATGQNALRQARQFHDAVGATGIALTKMDGTAKGGILFAISEALALPIRCIGVGEGVEDLRPFAAEPFVEAIMGGGGGAVERSVEGR